MSSASSNLFVTKQPGTIIFIAHLDLFSSFNHSSETDAAHLLDSDVKFPRLWNFTVQWVLVFFHHRNKSGFCRRKTGCDVMRCHSRSVSLFFVGQEEDDDARQQQHHHHHRRQEEGSARRPARQSEEGSAHAACLAAAPGRWAGKPHIQRAVH